MFIARQGSQQEVCNMKDEAEILLEYIKYEWEQARHHENQRANTANWIIVSSLGITGYIVERGLRIEIWPLTIALMVLGLYGLLASMKSYERFSFCMERAREWRKRIDELHPNAQVSHLMEIAGSKHSKKHRVSDKIRLHWVVNILHLGIALLGLILTLSLG
jgi:hypothetical protein